MYPGKGTVVLIRPAQTFYERIKAYQKHAWIVLLAIGILLALSGLFATFAGVDEREFEDSTGLAYSELSPAYPGVADYIERLIRLLGSSALALALFGVVVTWTGYRGGQRWAWFAMWILPAVSAAWAAIFFIAGSGLGYYYGGLTIVALVGLVLPIRRFFPKSDEAANP